MGVEACRAMPGARTTLQKLQRKTRHRLAENLRGHRQRLKLTQEEAAEEVGFSLQYYQRIERKIVNVPLDTIARFAHAFGVDPSELLAPIRPGTLAQRRLAQDSRARGRST